MALLLLGKKNSKSSAQASSEIDIPNLCWLPLLAIGLGAQLIFGLTSTPLVLLVASMLLIAAFLFVNRRRAGFPIVLIGVLLNVGVIAANGGMPVSAHAAAQVDEHNGVPSSDLRHVDADAGTRLSFLGDVIPLGDKVMSIGDLLMLGGLAVFLFSTARTVTVGRSQVRRPDAHVRMADH